MDDNPYQSPESEPEVEKRPKKPLSRSGSAGFLGLFAFLGGMLLYVLAGDLASYFEMWIQFDALWWLWAVVACAFGVIVACWTWRSPESKLPTLVIALLGSAICLVFLADVIIWVLLF